MPIEERRRIALHQHPSATWSEEVADTLFDLITPAGHDLATGRTSSDSPSASTARFDEVGHRLESFESRVDDRLGGFEASVGQRLAELAESFERRIADAVTTQTRTLVFSQLAALVVIAALAFGLR